jgi:hypothetical protein
MRYMLRLPPPRKALIYHVRCYDRVVNLVFKSNLLSSKEKAVLFKSLKLVTDPNFRL